MIRSQTIKCIGNLTLTIIILSNPGIAIPEKDSYKDICNEMNANCKFNMTELPPLKVLPRLPINEPKEIPVIPYTSTNRIKSTNIYRRNFNRGSKAKGLSNWNSWDNIIDD